MAGAGGAKLRANAARVVHAVTHDGRSLDAALEDADAHTAPADRPLLRSLAYGCLRGYYRQSAWIDALLAKPLKKRDLIVRALLAVGFQQLSDSRIPDHAAVAETVEATRLLRRPKLAGLVNALLRRFLRDGPPEIRETDAIRYGHPDWLIDMLRKDWPDDWETILAANNERAPMWLRVNARRIEPAAYAAMLEDAGIEFDADGVCIKLATPRPVAALPGFDEGLVSVQDAAAQLAAPWLLAKPAERVLDACAAPGGKTAHLAELGGPEVDLTAVDLSADRLQPLRANLERLGHAATVFAGDASKPEEWWDGRPFDAILADAPCSATGVIRRHPDIRILRRASDIAALAERQTALLKGLWGLLRPGGRLLYVTCSVLAAENDAVVSRFLAAQADASESDALQNNNIRDLMRRKACGYQVLPGTGGMDGFYFACLEKHVHSA